jgi:hypothetical protein
VCFVGWEGCIIKGEMMGFGFGTHSFTIGSNFLGYSLCLVPRSRSFSPRLGNCAHSTWSRTRPLVFPRDMHSVNTLTSVSQIR